MGGHQLAPEVEGKRLSRKDDAVGNPREVGLNTEVNCVIFGCNRWNNGM